MIYDAVIIGAGVIGAMTARELSKYDIKLLILEKENDVSCGASKANSGIVHGGFDPVPNTLKAEMNSRGVELLYKAAEELKVPCINNGSLVCAFDKEGEKELETLLDRALLNNIPNVEIVSGDKAREIEPALSGNITKVLISHTAGIISPYELTIAATAGAMKNGAELKRNFEVASINKEDGIFFITDTKGNTVKAKRVINCAGVHSGKVAELSGDDSIKIIARKGEYMLLDKTEGSLVSHTVFQIPTKAGKGVLVSPTVHGNLLVGPTAEAVENPEFTETTVSGLEMIKNTAKLSCEKIDYRTVITSFTGVRASTASGDFIIEPSKKVEGLFNIAAIDSPGLTSCVAIAQYAVEQLKNDGMQLVEKEEWCAVLDDPHFFSKMNDEEKNEFIKNNELYGKMVCRCEQVTEGEIRAALRREPKPYDIDGVKRRTRSSMGRCQGGFCMPTVMRIISEETGIPIEEITKKGKDSYQLRGVL
ncbi:MAG: FAD-dependent oxidoreductase [Acutalibacteraceae bacterium]|nr:FAD-dependent oxidoreductase [Acutalibacteraceae bacterium]